MRSPHYGGYRRSVLKMPKCRYELEPVEMDRSDPYCPNILFPTDAYHYFHGGRKLKTKKTRPVSLQSVYESAVQKLAGKLKTQTSKRSQDSDDDFDCKPPAKKPRNPRKCAVPPYSTMCALCFNDKGLVLQFRSQRESSKHMLAIHHDK